MAGSINDQVAIIGVGCTKFGDNFDQSFEDLLVEAGFAAFADARIEPERVEAAWLGTFSPYAGNGKASVSLADALRLYGKPITRVENYCATGTDAFRNAAMAVASGMYDVALVAGAEKLKDRPMRGLGWESGHPYQHDGLTAPGAFAMAANRYFHRFGAGREALAKGSDRTARCAASAGRAAILTSTTASPRRALSPWRRTGTSIASARAARRWPRSQIGPPDARPRLGERPSLPARRPHRAGRFRHGGEPVLPSLRRGPRGAGQGLREESPQRLDESQGAFPDGSERGTGAESAHRGVALRAVRLLPHYRRRGGGGDLPGRYGPPVPRRLRARERSGTGRHQRAAVVRFRE